MAILFCSSFCLGIALNNALWDRDDLNAGNFTKTDYFNAVGCNNEKIN
jgi:hypothetical protein